MKAYLLIALALLGACPAWAEVSIPVQTIILEAENQGFEGMVAVGEVIRNRAKRGHLSPDEVCLARRQFSAWNDRQWASKRLKQASPKVLSLATRAWEASKHSFKTQGATHYHTKAVRPYWSKMGIKTAVIGAHVFYKGVK